MNDLLPILLILFALWWFWRKGRETPWHKSQDRQPPEIIPCTRCGTYIPRSEATMVSGRAYCCREHSARGTR
ncbi:MAG: PP0621 family protein [Acidiferrobacteraceae bacterium]